MTPAQARKALKQIDHRLGRQYDALIDTLSTELDDINGKALAKLVTSLDRALTYDKHGNLERTQPNLLRVSQLDKEYAGMLDTMGRRKAITAFVGEFPSQLPTLASQLEIISDQLKRGPLNFKKVLAAPSVRELLGEQQRTTVEDMHEVAAKVATLAKRKVMLQYGGLDREKMTDLLSASLSRSAGETRTLGATSLAMFHRTAHSKAVDAIDPEQELLYAYDGPDDKLTRPFCHKLKALMAKSMLWTRREIDRMDNGQLGDCFTTGGGYNCRHQWRLALPDEIEAFKQAFPRKAKKLPAAATEAPINLAGVIRKPSDKNPYKSGTAVANDFDKLRDGMTVEEALKLGVQRKHLQHAESKGHLSITSKKDDDQQPEPPPPPSGAEDWGSGDQRRFPKFNEHTILTSPLAPEPEQGGVMQARSKHLDAHAVETAGVLQDVRVDSLNVWQTELFGKQLQAFKDKGFDRQNAPPIQVVKWRGRYVVFNGNHRAAAAWVSKEEAIAARVLDLDDPANKKYLKPEFAEEARLRFDNKQPPPPPPPPPPDPKPAGKGVIAILVVTNPYKPGSAVANDFDKLRTLPHGATIKDALAMGVARKHILHAQQKGYLSIDGVGGGGIADPKPDPKPKPEPKPEPPKPQPAQTADTGPAVRQRIADAMQAHAAKIQAIRDQNAAAREEIRLLQQSLPVWAYNFDYTQKLAGPYTSMVEAYAAQDRGEIPRGACMRREKASGAIQQKIDALEQDTSARTSLINDAYEERRRIKRQLVSAPQGEFKMKPVYASKWDKFPAAKKKIEEGLAEFGRLVGDNKALLKTVKVHYYNDREQHNGVTNAIEVNHRTGIEVIVHEMGHWLEHTDPNVHAKAVAFLERRTKGETAQKLKVLTGISAYKDNEIAMPDKFKSPYTGKVYSWTNEGSGKYERHAATEVVSMGLQYMYEDAEQFMKDDPDFFDFTYELMRDQRQRYKGKSF